MGWLVGCVSRLGRRRALGSRGGGPLLRLRTVCPSVPVLQIFGREKQIQRMAQILARRTKNNPILLGEAGVGKTAIAEGLACAIVRGTHEDGAAVPDFLLRKRILSLDVGLMVAGAKERGELENRVTKLIAECREDGDIILM